MQSMPACGWDRCFNAWVMRLAKPKTGASSPSSTCSRYEIEMPTPEPHIRLDYVFAPHAQAGRVITCEVVRTAAAAAASDHFPVVSDLKVDD